MRGEARSLNLACSVAVAAYEALRQIELQGASVRTDRNR
jgi:tRNA(Leu) C34 or U34 (ribose-2'-O)-methylase TrmL